MSNPIVGLGTTVEFASVGSPASFTTLVGVSDVKFSGDKVATEKTTNMLTPNGVDTYIGSTQDPGTCDIKCFYEPGDSSQVALEAIRLAATAIPVKVLYPASGSKSFTAIVESATISLPLEKAATIDYKLKLSGPWTIV
jgi:Lambda phage tail tube protein, TTP